MGLKFWTKKEEEQLDRIEGKVDDLNEGMDVVKKRQDKVERRLTHVESAVGMNPILRRERRKSA